MKKNLFLLFVLLLLSACRGGEIELAPASFTNVAQEVGVDFRQGAFRWGMSGDPVAMMGGGLCWLDYDNDGWLDLYVVNSYTESEAGQWDQAGGRPTNGLFKNEEGTFSDVSAHSKTDISVRGNGCVAADFDNNGFTDIYVTTARFNVLLWNMGDGTFREGAKLAGVDAYGWQSAVSVADLNNDGWLDLFIAGYVNINRQIISPTMGFPNTNEGLRDLLYISNGVDSSGQVTYTEVGEQVGLETENFAYGLGSVLLDFDDDGDLDLYVANDTNANMLYAYETNDSDLGFHFEAVGAQANVDDINSGMGVAGGDYDGNGQPDIFVTNMGPQTHSLYANEANLAFTNGLDSVGLPEFGAGWTGWGTAWQDFDNDTDLDLFLANGAIPVVDLDADRMLQQLFENQTAQGDVGVLAEISDVAGITELGAMIGRGVSTADYDNDGDIDIAINSIANDLVLLENTGATGNWLTVQLDGLSAGATVTATLSNGQTLTRYVLVGSSYLSSEDPRVHFGLGNETVVSLEVRWADGHVMQVPDVGVNELLVIEK